MRVGGAIPAPASPRFRCPGQPMKQSTAEQAVPEQTLDLHELARVLKGERIEVEARRRFETTDELFQRTLRLLRTGAGQPPEAPPAPRRPSGDRYIPENEDLRKIYLFAEALGGYERLYDLINVHSPGRKLSRDYREKADRRLLTREEVRTLEEYQRQINEALTNAHQYLLDNPMQHFTPAEMHELFDLLTTASRRSRELTRIIGTHLVHEIEQAVRRLYEFQQMIRTVHRTVDGIFLVNSEVMFIPTIELIECVNNIFRGVGNPYVAEHVDGVMLLAARNLLIEVASFHSYYGKQQIYKLVRKGGSGASTHAIAHRIRHEVKKLFEACQADNKLVLRRVMQNAEREFEMSVQAIEAEAVAFAVQEVRVFLPEEPPPAPPRRKGLLVRLFGWLWA